MGEKKIIVYQKKTGFYFKIHQVVVQKTGFYHQKPPFDLKNDLLPQKQPFFIPKTNSRTHHGFSTSITMVIILVPGLLRSLFLFRKTLLHLLIQCVQKFWCDFLNLVILRFLE